MKFLSPTTTILAPHIADTAVLEVDALFQNSQTLALICHPNPKVEGGNMTNKVVTTMYRFCRDMGMDVVRFNYRGVGRSSGTVEYGDGEFLDALCVLRWAMTQSSANKLWLGGFSFGGFIACRVADYITHHDMIDLEKLVLIAPSVEKNAPDGLMFETDKAVVIYGDKDEFVRPSSMEKFANAFGIRQKILPDATHFFHGRLGELKTLLLDDTMP